MQDYYKEASLVTTLNSYETEVQKLPNDIKELCAWVQNILIHAYWLEKYSVLPEIQHNQFEMQLRNCCEILDQALLKNSQPLGQKRKPSERVVSICRDFSVLLCAVFRAKNIPARVRCGFATYLTPNRFEDHWVCEYWHCSECRWVTVDAQLDDVHRQNLKLDFNPLDVPSTRFISAGEAWRLCRAGVEDSQKFGIHHFNGLAFIKGNVIRDLFALSKIELLAWDTGWGILPDYISVIENCEELSFIDKLAVISNESDSDSAVNVVATNPEVRLPVDWDNYRFPTITELWAKLA